MCLLSGSQVVLAADMLGLDGLKDVVEMVLTRDYCRFFPKVSCHRLMRFQTVKEFPAFTLNLRISFPYWHTK